MVITGIRGYENTVFSAAEKKEKSADIYSGWEQDEVVISQEGNQAAEFAKGRFSEMKTMTRDSDFDNMLADFIEKRGDLEVNWNATVDPDGQIYWSAYIESVLTQYQEAESRIREYYADAHKENLSFDNPYNHIYAKYITNDLFPKSQYFRSDMSAAERKMAFYQERAILWGGNINLNDPYALAASGGVLTKERVESTAHKYAQDKLDILIRERKKALGIEDESADENANKAGGTKETEETKKTEQTEKAEDKTSPSAGGSVKFNAEKRSRQLNSAQTPEQVRIVMSLLAVDMSDCKAGLQKGWCDEAEVAKVEAMIQRAKERMSQVSGNSEAQSTGTFELNMLM